MSFLRRGIEWLHSVRHQQMAEAVTYTRRSGGSTSLSATLARASTEQMVEQELFVNSQFHDFIVRTVDLRIAGVFAAPAPGDRITVAATGGVYEVCELGMDRCWRYSDEFEQAVRVHARRV